MMSQTSVSTVKGFPGVPLDYANEKEHRRTLARAINRINGGKLNCILDVTLSANTGATVISDDRVGFYTAVVPAMPLSLDAAADIGTIWCDAPTGGPGATTATITVHHRNSAATDRKIRFLILD